MNDIATIPEIAPSAGQSHAIEQISYWYGQCEDDMADSRPLQQQVFRMFGYAGTGKTTTLKYAIADLDISNVLYGAFTGKAALVMTQKGTPATTIHSMCYKVHEPTQEEIASAKMELAKLRETGPGEMDLTLWRAMIRTREEAIKDMHKPTFILNSEGAIRDANLIVLDEVSMVGPEMAADLMSFGKPILVLGDPGQLPPIKGEGAFTQCEPDVMLTEIHRQAEGSAIIRLATMARNGEYIPYDNYSDTVCKIKKSVLGPADMLMADQVMCGMNATRLMLNNAMRDAQGFRDILPEGPKEKIICLKNNKNFGLINGGFLTLDNIEQGGEHGFSAMITTDDGRKIGEKVKDRPTIYKGHFIDHQNWDKDRAQKDHWHKKGMVEATFGNAITVHKSQGSSWPNIIVFDDGFGRGDDRNKWLYTALTRAEQGLCILA